MKPFVLDQRYENATVQSLGVLGVLRAVGKSSNKIVQELFRLKDSESFVNLHLIFRIERRDVCEVTGVRQGDHG